MFEDLKGDELIQGYRLAGHECRQIGIVRRSLFSLDVRRMHS